MFKIRLKGDFVLSG